MRGSAPGALPSALLVAAATALLVPSLTGASATQIKSGTMTVRLDPRLTAAGVGLGSRTQRTVPVRPGASVSERSGGGHYRAARPLVLRAGSRSVALGDVEVRISGGKGTLRADVAGRRLSVAKVRHASISAQTGRIRVSNGRLRLTIQGARALRRALRVRAISAHGTLGSVSIDVTTTAASS